MRINHKAVTFCSTEDKILLQSSILHRYASLSVMFRNTLISTVEVNESHACPTYDWKHRILITKYSCYDLHTLLISRPTWSACVRLSVLTYAATYFSVHRVPCLWHHRQARTLVLISRNIIYIRIPSWVIAELKVNIAVPTYSINLIFVIKVQVCNVDDYISITRDRKAELFNTPRKWIIIANVIFILKNLLDFRLVGI